MKKLFAVALFSLGAIVLGTGTASAGWFSHFCCDHKCYLTIRCKQYNAFSPSAFGCATFSPCCAPCNHDHGGYPCGADCDNGICGNGAVIGQYGGVVTLPPANVGPAYPTANVPPQWVPPTANGPTGYLLPGQGRPFPAQPTGLGPNFQGFQGYPGGYAPPQVPQQWAPQYWGNPQGAYPGR